MGGFLHSSFHARTPQIFSHEFINTSHPHQKVQAPKSETGFKQTEKRALALSTDTFPQLSEAVTTSVPELMEPQSATGLATVGFRDHSTFFPWCLQGARS